MAMKPEQQRIKNLLAETITLLCRDGLDYKSEFRIEALIGITLDQSDVFLVSIKETVNRSSETNSESAESVNGIVQLADENEDQYRNIDADVPTAWQSVIANSMKLESLEGHRETFKSNLRAIGLARGASIDAGRKNIVDRAGWPLSGRRSVTKWKSLRHRARNVATSRNGNFSSIVSCVSLNGMKNFDRQHEVDQKNVVMQECPMQDDSDQPVNQNLTSLEHVSRQPQSSYHLSNNSESRLKNCSILDMSPDQSNPQCSDRQRISKKLSRMPDTSPEQVTNWDHIETNSSRIKTEPVTENEEIFTEDGGTVYGQWSNERGTSSQPSWNIGVLTEGMDSVQRGRDYRPRKLERSEAAASHRAQKFTRQSPSMISSSPTSVSTSAEISSNPDNRNFNQPGDSFIPNLNASDVEFARSILCMRGLFVNVGSIKANNKFVRRVSHDELTDLLERMFAPASCNTPFFVGHLVHFNGITRILYKCPPSMISEAALGFYRIAPEQYAEAYAMPVLVERKIRDPFAWIQSVLDQSPFNSMHSINAD